MAGMPSRGFQGFPGSFHPVAHIRPADLAWQAELGRQIPDKPRIPGGLAATQPVIQMTHDQIPESRRHQQMQQRHGIRTARHANKISRRSR